MKRAPIIRKTPLKRGRAPIRKTRLRARPRRLDPLLRRTLRWRARNRCERCGISDQVRACQAHHALLRSQGGKDELSNLKYVCYQCHQHIHQHPAEAARGGWIISAKTPTDQEAS